MSNYSELLKDPRWQRKRLEIYQLDGWRCRKCCSKENTLNVHHLYYEKNRMPWEYDNSALVTLCERCHSIVRNINWQRAFLDINMTEFDLLDLALQIKFRKQKFEIQLKEVHAKHGTRATHIYMAYDLFKNQEEVDEYYRNFLREHEGRYNGEKIH